MLVMIMVIVLGFGVMGIWLQDLIFIYVKLIIINFFLFWLILVLMVLWMNVWKIFFQYFFILLDEVWIVFLVCWVIWFQFLVLFNEFFWCYIGDGMVLESVCWFVDFSIIEFFWVNFKLVILFLGMGFMFVQMFLLMKYQVMVVEDVEVDVDEKKDVQGNNLCLDDCYFCVIFLIYKFDGMKWSGIC